MKFCTMHKTTKSLNYFEKNNRRSQLLLVGSVYFYVNLPYVLLKTPLFKSVFFRDERGFRLGRCGGNMYRIYDFPRAEGDT